MGSTYCSILSLVIFHVINQWMTVTECAHGQSSQQRSLSVRLPDLIGPVGSSRQWFQTNKNNKLTERPTFQFFRPFGLGWPSSSSHLFQSNQVPLSTGRGMFTTWPSLPTTSSGSSPLRQVVRQPQTNGNLSSANQSPAKSSLSTSHDAASPIYKNDTSSIDTTVLSSLPTEEIVDSNNSNKTAMLSERKDNSSLFRAFPTLPNNPNDRQALLTSKASARPTLNALSNVATVSPAIKSLNSHTKIANPDESDFRKWSKNVSSNEKRTTGKFFESHKTDTKTKTNDSDMNKTTFRLGSMSKTENGKGRKFFRQLRKNGNQVKGAKPNDTHATRFQSMFQELMLPSSVPKSSKYFINMPDSIRNRIKAMNTESSINTQNKSPSNLRIPSTKLNEKDIINDVESIFKRLHLPQFERKHLKLPSLAIQDNLRKLVINQIRNRETVPKHSKSESNTTDKMPTHLIIASAQSDKVPTQKGNHKSTTKHRATGFQKQLTEEAIRHPLGRPNEKTSITVPLSGKEKRTTEENTGLSLHLNNSQTETGKINFMLPFVENNSKTSMETIRAASKNINKKGRQEERNILTRLTPNDYDSLEMRKDEVFRNHLIQSGETRNTSAEHMIPSSVPVLGKPPSEIQFPNSKERSKIIIQRGNTEKVNILPALEKHSKDLITSQLSKIQTTSKHNISQRINSVSVIPLGHNEKTLKVPKLPNGYSLQTHKPKLSNSHISKKTSFAQMTKEYPSIKAKVFPVTMQIESEDGQILISKFDNHLSNKLFSTTEQSIPALLPQVKDKDKLHSMRSVSSKHQNHGDLLKEMIKQNSKVQQNEKQTAEDSMPFPSPVLDRTLYKETTTPTVTKKTSSTYSEGQIVIEKVNKHLLRRKQPSHQNNTLKHLFLGYKTQKNLTSPKTTKKRNHATNPVPTKMNTNLIKTLNFQIRGKTSKDRSHYIEPNKFNKSVESVNLKLNGIDSKNTKQHGANSNSTSNLQSYVITNNKITNNNDENKAYDYYVTTVIPMSLIAVRTDGGYRFTTVSPLSKSVFGNMDSNISKNTPFTLSKAVQSNRKAEKEDLYTRNLQRENNKSKRKQKRKNLLAHTLTINKPYVPFQKKAEKRIHTDRIATKSLNSLRQLASSDQSQNNPSEVSSSELLEKLLTGGSGNTIHLFNVPSNEKYKQNKSLDSAKSSTPTGKATKVKSSSKETVNSNLSTLNGKQDSRALPISILEMFHYGLPESKIKKDLTPTKPKIGNGNMQKKATVHAVPRVDITSIFRKGRKPDRFNTKNTGNLKAYEFRRIDLSDILPNVLQRKIEKSPDNDYMNYPLRSAVEDVTQNINKGNKQQSQPRSVIKDGTRTGINILNSLLYGSAKRNKGTHLFHVSPLAGDGNDKKLDQETNTMPLNRIKETSMSFQPKRTVPEHVFERNKYFERKNEINTAQREQTKWRLSTPLNKDNGKPGLNRLDESRLQHLLFGTSGKRQNVDPFGNFGVVSQQQINLPKHFVLSKQVLGNRKLGNDQNKNKRLGLTGELNNAYRLGTVLENKRQTSTENEMQSKTAAFIKNPKTRYIKGHEGRDYGLPKISNWQRVNANTKLVNATDFSKKSYHYKQFSEYLVLQDKMQDVKKAVTLKPTGLWHPNWPSLEESTFKSVPKSILQPLPKSTLQQLQNPHNEDKNTKHEKTVYKLSSNTSDESKLRFNTTVPKSGTTRALLFPVPFRF